MNLVRSFRGRGFAKIANEKQDANKKEILLQEVSPFCLNFYQFLFENFTYFRLKITYFATFLKKEYRPCLAFQMKQHHRLH